MELYDDLDHFQDHADLSDGPTSTVDDESQSGCLKVWDGDSLLAVVWFHEGDQRWYGDVPPPDPCQCECCNNGGGQDWDY